MGQYNPNEFQPGFGGVINSDGDVVNLGDVINEDGRVKIDAQLTVSDLEIGAVEIKNGMVNTAPEANYRMRVNEDGSLNMRIVGSIDGGTF